MSMVTQVKAAIDGLIKSKEIIDGQRFYEDALVEAREHHRQWFQNIADYLGLHHLEWAEMSRWFIIPARRKHRVRLVVNFIMPTIRTAVAKLLKSNPSFTAIPSVDDDNTEEATLTAQKLLKTTFYEKRFQRKIRKFAWWLFTCAQAYLVAQWDANANKAFTVEVPIDPENPEAGTEPRTLHLGDVRYSYHGPFEVLLQPGADEEFEEHTRAMIVKLMPTRELKDKWGKEVPAESFENGEFNFLHRIKNLVDARGRIQLGELRENLENMAMEKSYFERPSSQFPNGRHFVYANGVILQPTKDLDFWYQHERVIPIAKVDDIEVPGRAYASSGIEQISGINKVFNRLNSSAVEDVNMLGRGKVLAPKGSMQDETWDDAPGEIAEYTPIGGHKPEVIRGVEITQGLLVLRDSMPQYMREVYGINEVSFGRLPRRATSGKALDILQEADDTRIGIIVKNFSDGLSKQLSIGLKLMQDNYDEERIVRLVGENHRVETKKFSKADLKGADEIRVEITPALSRGQAIRIAMDLLETKAISTAQALKVMQLGTLDVIFDEGSDHLNFSGFENFQMAKGIRVATGEFEDQLIHKGNHIRFLNSPAGLRLSPEIRQIFTDHIKEHDARQAQQQPISDVQGAPGGGAPPTDAGEALPELEGLPGGDELQ